MMMTSILQYSINLQKAWHVELPFQQDIIHTLRNTYSINILREGKRNPLFTNISLGIINRTFLKKKKKEIESAMQYYICNTCCIYLPWGAVRVKFWQTTCPWSSNIRVDKLIMATNDTKDAQSNTDRDIAYSSKQETTVFEIQTRDIIPTFSLGGLRL